MNTQALEVLSQEARSLEVAPVNENRFLEIS